MTSYCDTENPTMREAAEEMMRYSKMSKEADDYRFRVRWGDVVQLVTAVRVILPEISGSEDSHELRQIREALGALVPTVELQYDPRHRFGPDPVHLPYGTQIKEGFRKMRELEGNLES